MILDDPLLPTYLDAADGWFVLGRQRLSGEQCHGAVVIGSDIEQLRGDGFVMPDEDESTGLFSRVDHQGNWSIERISPPPFDTE